MSNLYATWLHGWSTFGSGPGTALSDSGESLVIRADGAHDHPSPVELRGRSAGPGDVVGVAERSIRRRVPHPDGSIGAAKLAFIEFQSPSFPWALSPKPSGSDPIQPWLALVLIPFGDSTATITPSGGGEILTCTTAHLPVLAELHGFCHAQEYGSSGVSRLIAPTGLKAGTRYTAVLVPTFASGRAAGLSSRGIETAFSGAADDPAWEASDTTVILPVYQQWTITAVTALRLAERVDALRRPDVQGLGWRNLKTDAAGLSIPDAGTHPVPGVLVPPGTAPTVPWTAGVEAAFRTAVLSKLDVEDPGSTTPPTVGPPMRAPRLFGSSLPGGTAVDETLGWVDELNLLPASRVAAGLGESLVRDDQERFILPLQASIPLERIRRDDSRLEVAQALLNEHVGASTTVHPAWGLLLPGTTDTHEASTVVGSTMADPALRRALRPGSALGRQMARAAGHSVGTAALAFDTANGRPRSFLQSNEVERLQALTGTEGGSVTAFQVPRPLDPAPGPYPAVQPMPARTTPQDTRLRGRASRNALVSSRDLLDARHATAQAGRIRTAPVSPVALLDVLARKDPTWVVPGLENTPPESVLVLQANAAFVESLMIGANEELLRELQWREIPYNAGEALLPSFWKPSAPDLDLGEDWADGALGTHVASGGTWVLVRSALWQMCPDLIVQAFTATFSTDPDPVPIPDTSGGTWSNPIQEIQLTPDTMAVEFDLTVEQLLGSETGAGSFLVFSEPDIGASFRRITSEGPGPLSPTDTEFRGDTEADERMDPPDEVWVWAGRYAAAAEGVE